MTKQAIKPLRDQSQRADGQPHRQHQAANYLSPDNVATTASALRAARLPHLRRSLRHRPRTTSHRHQCVRGDASTRNRQRERNRRVLRATGRCRPVERGHQQHARLRRRLQRQNRPVGRRRHRVARWKWSGCD